MLRSSHTPHSCVALVLPCPSRLPQEKAQKLVQLKAFHKFEDTTDAMAATTAIVEGKLGKSLKKFLKGSIVKKGLTDQLAVMDTKVLQCASLSRVTLSP